MKYLIAGLGNVGAQYTGTRHNIGFAILDALAQQQGATFALGRLGYTAQLRYRGRDLHLLKPTTYMNESGKALRYWLQALKVPVERLLVVVDELSLPFGTLRLRAQGGSGGHNGLKSIEAALQTRRYARLRFGIGKNFSAGQQADYVLGPFSNQEQKELPLLVERAGQMVQHSCYHGLTAAMNAYH